jgi:hypothetical protein
VGALELVERDREGRRRLVTRAGHGVSGIEQAVLAEPRIGGLYRDDDDRRVVVAAQTRLDDDPHGVLAVLRPDRVGQLRFVRRRHIEGRAEDPPFARRRRLVPLEAQRRLERERRIRPALEPVDDHVVRRRHERHGAHARPARRMERVGERQRAVRGDGRVTVDQQLADGQIGLRVAALGGPQMAFGIARAPLERGAPSTRV